jgi:hypothetical protein
VFFHLAVLLTKPHPSSDRLTVPLFKLTQQLRQLCDIRRDPPRLCRMYPGHGLTPATFPIHCAETVTAPRQAAW